MDSSENSNKLMCPISSYCKVRRNYEEDIPLQGMHTSTSSSTKMYASIIFETADEDHDGFISLNELQRSICENGFTEDPIPDHVVREIFQFYDKNNDGQLDYDEFVTMITDPKFRSIFGVSVTKYVSFVVPRKRFDLDKLDLTQLNEDEYSCWPPKVGIIIISLIELIFFLVDKFNAKDSSNFPIGSMAKTFIYDPSKRYQFWRYLTYMFVHIGYFHLSINLIFQILIGVPLEIVHDWWRVLIIYFAGVLAGSLGTSITDPTCKLAGASGGVYSLITAHIATIIMNWKEMSFPAVQLIIFLFVTGVDVGVSVYDHYWTSKGEYTGYVAHFAGAASGILVGIVFLKNLKLTKKTNILWLIAVAAYVLSILVGICWNIFYTDYFPKQV